MSNNSASLSRRRFTVGATSSMVLIALPASAQAAACSVESVPGDGLSTRQLKTIENGGVLVEILGVSGYLISAINPVTAVIITTAGLVLVISGGTDSGKEALDYLMEMKESTLQPFCDLFKIPSLSDPAKSAEDLIKLF